MPVGGRQGLFRQNRLPQKQASTAVTMNAPVGGINTVTAAGAMPATDCLALKNMIPYQYGLRVRAGFQDWFTGIQNAAGEFEKITTLMPFNGSTSGGYSDRLFACTKSGIWDVTTQTNDITALVHPNDPECVYQFPITFTGAGIGISTAFTNSAGEHFLAYCDEANGYLLYREGTGAWEKILQSPNVEWTAATVYTVGTKIVNKGLAYNCTTGGTSTAKWMPNTAYIVGDLVVNGLGLYRCTTAGTSLPSGGPTGIGAGESDGAVTWEYVSLSGPLGAGDVIVEGTVTWDYYPSIAGANPDTFAFVMQWKNRLWFVPKNSQDAYYLEVGVFAGQAHKMIFAPRFKYGGSLVGLWAWTLDGGVGVDDHLVAISSGGDVAVYVGTDPSSAATFGLKGVWWIGPVPPGRSIASDFGGDLFVLSRVGCLPLSRLVAGGLIRDPSVYETSKVANLFNQLMSERGMYPGWALTQHPDDNLIVINVPGISGGPSEQLVMSLATKGWAQHTGVPIVCMSTWHGFLYFGTSDGRVCVSRGYFDSGLSATDNGCHWEYHDDGSLPIDFALLSAYTNLGNANKKRVHMARPYFATNGSNPGYSIAARYDYDLSDLPLTAVTAIQNNPLGWGVTTPASGGVWSAYPPISAAVTGDAIWGSGVGIAGKQYGTAGMGTVVAVVIRGSSGASTTLISIDVLMDQGWYL
jgi:hypothetical protein